MTEVIQIYKEKYFAQDPRLGRNLNHDSRSKAFQVVPMSVDTLKSVRHERFIPMLNQGTLGSCTGHAAAACLGMGHYWHNDQIQQIISRIDPVAISRWAVQLYSEATQIDPFAGSYPPTDTGSDGLTIAKVLKKRGLISGYVHAMSLPATLTALSKGPVTIGTRWLSDMFNPASDGRISVSGSLQGGHQYVLSELDVERERVWIDNSWGEEWGIKGRAYLTWGNLGTLLSRGGDVTVFVPNTAPAPEPSPPPAPVVEDVAPVVDPLQELKEKAQELDNALHQFLDKP